MRLLRGQIRQLMDWQQQYLPRTLRKQQPFLTVCRLEQYGKYIINTPTSCKVWLGMVILASQMLDIGRVSNWFYDSFKIFPRF